MMLFFVLVSLLLAIYFLCLASKQSCSKEKVCLVGKTALVTGGNSGIGYEIVLALAQRGCRVVVADKVKSEKLLENIFRETQSKNIEFKYVDLSLFQSVRGLSEDLARNEEKLDILVHNAGVANIMAVTEDGYDHMMQVNYFSPFLLTHLLLDMLKIAEGRIIFTSSITSHLHNFSLDRLRATGPDCYVRSYPNSKLCLLISGDMFAEKLKRYGITSNTYDPGMVNTNIFTVRSKFSHSVFIWIGTKLMRQIVKVIGKNAEEAAQTAIHLACANEVKNVTGKYFYETKITYKPRLAHNKKICQQIWKATEEIVGLTEHEKI